MRAGRTLRGGRRDLPGLSDLIESAFSELESEKLANMSELSSDEFLLPGGALGNVIAGRRLLGKGRAVIDTRRNLLVSQSDLSSALSDLDSDRDSISVDSANHSNFNSALSSFLSEDHDNPKKGSEVHEINLRRQANPLRKRSHLPGALFRHH